MNVSKGILQKGEAGGREAVVDERRTYVAIDLKSFYASVECVERNLDPLVTNLVVADPDRTEKTICLAVSPSLKAYGISGRARLFEVIRRVREVNGERLARGVREGILKRGGDGRHHFAGSSYNALELDSDPSLELSYVVAPPRMKLYEEYGAKIYSTYLKYVAPEDIHVYSIDEVFMDVTAYLGTYGVTAHELAMTIMKDVLNATGITATAGIGTNLYLCKVAMDVVAKHVPPDGDGVRIAELDEKSYRESLWCHRPITDFWRVGRGTGRKLEGLGIFTMGDLALASLSPKKEERLYEAFGVNAEILIDHAWGWEPVTMSDIKAYKPGSNSISHGQVLKTPYDYEKGCLIVKEMAELLALELVRRGLVTRQVVLEVGYDRESIVSGGRGRNSYRVARTGKNYGGIVENDPYGRPCPRRAHGTGNLDRYTSSAKRMMDAAVNVYSEIVDPDLLIRRVNMTACALIREDEVPAEEPVQLDFFTDYEELERKRREEDAADEKERKLQKATLALQSKYGKNVILKGMNLQEGATTMERNAQVGGHRAE